MNPTRAQLQTAASGEHTVVLVCSDILGHGSAQAFARSLPAALRRSVPNPGVHLVQDLCSGSPGLPALLRGLAAQRVVVACSQTTSRRPQILKFLRSAGIHPAGAQIVGLLQGEQADSRGAAEQSVALIRAALARVRCADLTTRGDWRVQRDPSRVSRRSLFGLGDTPQPPIASWTGRRCDGHGGCLACVKACPHGALTRGGAGPSINVSRCTGCGACVSACRSGSMSLHGASIPELEAATAVLVAEALRLGPESVRGVAIVCTDALSRIPLGCGWLPLEVPSLEMVTTGWPLQILHAGVGVNIVGCDDAACVTHGTDVATCCTAVVAEIMPAWHRLIGWQVDSQSTPGWAEPRWIREVTPRQQISIELREPEATVGVLGALQPGMHGLVEDPLAPSVPTPAASVAEPAEGHNPAWRVEAAAASLGEITIAASGCSECGSCVLVCPTGALLATVPDEQAWALTIDPSACTACGACVDTCPEGVVSLRRVIDLGRLAHGRYPLVERSHNDACESCGRPLAAGLSRKMISARLAVSHPEISQRLRLDRRCTDCQPAFLTR